MGAGHNHNHKASHDNQRRLLMALVIAAVYMVAEFIGGLMTGSLALLADAGHMLSDVAALGLSVFALRMAQKPATPTRTYGFHRTEIIAALINGATLFMIAALILKEAWERIDSPPAVSGMPMMLIATGGLVVNILGLLILHGGHSHNLNVRGAYFHVMSDALGSLGAMAAGAMIWLFGWNWADPVISAVIAVLVAASAWHLVRQSVAVLMEGAPSGLDVDEVREALLAIYDVEGVHDLHVWSITSGMDALSVHLVVGPQLTSADRDHLLSNARSLLDQRFGIDHVTIQVEPPGFADQCCLSSHT